MSYAVSAALQTAVYGALNASSALNALIGNAVYDAEPAGKLPASYVSLGGERARDRSDKSGAGAVHEFDIAVVTEAEGFLTAKQIAAAVSDALVGADLNLSRGRLVFLNFARARAARAEKGRIRRIDLTFRARVQDDQ
ncbi:MAG: DUF3168 domain-containing protein [Litoreibacter sp.]|nr:DUF3168 domain-containing protein [Litoreibacter sp.]